MEVPGHRFSNTPCKKMKEEGRKEGKKEKKKKRKKKREGEREKNGSKVRRTYFHDLYGFLLIIDR